MSFAGHDPRAIEVCLTRTELLVAWLASIRWVVAFASEDHEPSARGTAQMTPSAVIRAIRRRRPRRDLSTMTPLTLLRRIRFVFRRRTQWPGLGNVAPVAGAVAIQ